MSLVRRIKRGKQVKVWEQTGVDSLKNTRKFTIYLSWYEQKNQSEQLNQLTKILEECDED